MGKNNEAYSTDTVTFQSLLRRALTEVLNNCDFDQLVADLKQLDNNLIQGGLEKLAIHFELSKLPPDASGALRHRQAMFAVFSLRVELLRHLLGVPSFRAFSMTLASSDLLSDFCGIRSVFGVKWTSKSTLHRASQLFTDEQLHAFNTRLVELAGD